MWSGAGESNPLLVASEKLTENERRHAPSLPLSIGAVNQVLEIPILTSIFMETSADLLLLDLIALGQSLLHFLGDLLTPAVHIPKILHITCLNQ